MRFDTMADARAAGYVEARGWHHDYMGLRLYARDASGSRASGERYELVVGAHADPSWSVDSPGDGYPPGWEGHPLQSRTFGQSVAVNISDVLNNMRQPGAYVVMLAPQTIAAAVEAFREQADLFYRENAAAAEWEARRQEIVQRPGARLARIGNALYGPRWQSDLARDLGVADRTVRAWVAGDRRPAPGVWIDLERLVRERRGALDALLQPAVPH